MEGRVLVIAGSDSGGGAGIQADIKTITALGSFAATAITALTAQNTLGIQAVEPVEPLFVEKQIDSVLDDIGADAIKLGMLASHTTVELVARRLETKAQSIPIVLDPVILASDGSPLLNDRGIDALRERLLPQCALITPNLDEAARLVGGEVDSVDSMQRAADLLLLQGAAAVLITGGHLEGDEVTDLLRTADGEQLLIESPRVHTRSTHGTGCTLSSAVAAGIARGLTLSSAVTIAHEYVQRALRLAPGYGKGRGPLNHAHPFITEAEA
ncbi:MAG: bifunctional hydroxymethylpyrimidine kinase/phosphomethylpyrimidine kinase [Polyangiaceae bacterium]|nr:bifunctional hydroxymethylpyrimidine kinase/phosphomethylpyrimidine kinase [Polyangiaceae bacterium]